MFCLLLYALFTTALAKDENVLMSEVFDITINPAMFNWSYEGIPDQYVYQASLLNAPDLPSWISYVYSDKHHAGFLYGVPPNKHNLRTNLDIIALNRKDYTTRHETLTIHVTEKLNRAKYEVQMKIDNLNVEDMFDIQTMDRLKDVFRRQLWKDSQNDLYLTFLASAVQLGARKPLNPNEGEGVVLRLGSTSPFSSELRELQEEVRPLWKVPSCPRNFKRTSVERFFRDAGFALDWCSFRLTDDSNSAMQKLNTNTESLSHLQERIEEEWESIYKSEVPERSYTNEFLITVLIPLFFLLLLAFVVSFVLCFHHEGISRNLKKSSRNEINQYATIHRATQSLRSLSNNREFASLSPEAVLLSRSHTNSPTSTLSRGMHCRPSPPPYVRPKFKPGGL